MLSRYTALTLSACHTLALKINFAMSFFQLLSYEDLQRGKLSYHSISVISSEALSLFFIPKPLFSACMFLEDSAVGRKVWQEHLSSLLNKVAELLRVALQQEALRDGPLCYIAVKVHGFVDQS